MGGPANPQAMQQTHKPCTKPLLLSLQLAFLGRQLPNGCKAAYVASMSVITIFDNTLITSNIGWTALELPRAMICILSKQP